MMAMFPVLISSGFLAILVAAGSEMRGGREPQDSWLFNMELIHRAAIDVAARRGFSAGAADPDMPWPFRNPGSWRSEIIADAGRSVVLTWPSGGNLPAGSARALRERFRPAVLPALGGGRRLRHFLGEFARTEDSRASIGGTDIPSPSADIAAGLPVMGSWVLQ